MDWKVWQTKQTSRRPMMYKACTFYHRSRPRLISRGHAAKIPSSATSTSLFRHLLSLYTFSRLQLAPSGLWSRQYRRTTGGISGFLHDVSLKADRIHVNISLLRLLSVSFVPFRPVFFGMEYTESSPQWQKHRIVPEASSTRDLGNPGGILQGQTKQCCDQIPLKKDWLSPLARAPQ